MVSEYNLIKFILNKSYNDHYLQENPDWNDWFNSISRLYNNKMPKSLILGLKRKNNDKLRNLCDNALILIQQREDKYKERLEQELLKYQKWMWKRDEGNKRVNEKKMQKIETNILKESQERQIANESYIKQMLPTWHAVYDECKNKREQEYNQIWNKTSSK